MKYYQTYNTFQLSGIENINESLSTHYLVYKIINNINGKHYIGQHKTNNINDNYMGSGHMIKLAYKKYQLSSFTKIILFDFDNFEEMKKKKKELVPLSCCYPMDPMSYNIQEGGKQHQMNNNTKRLLSKAQSRYQSSLSIEKKIENQQTQKEIWENKSQQEKNKIIEKCRKANTGNRNPMYKHACTEYMSKEKIKQWKSNISKAISGKNNPMYGKHLFDFMTEEQIIQWKQKHKYKNKMDHPCYGRKMMYAPDKTRHYIKKDEVQKYLKLGWKLSNLEMRKLNVDKNNQAYGKKWIYNPNTKETLFVKLSDIDKYFHLGFILGNGRHKK